LSLISRFIAAAQAASDGWAVVGTGTPSSDALGGFNTQEDAEFAITARAAADEFVTLYDAAKAINARSVLGITYIRAAERKALTAALAKLEA
jgi:hypothetical protein